MNVEYRITLADGQTFYLTVYVRKDDRTLSGSAHAHRRALNDGLILAAVQAQHTSWWPVDGEFNKVEFWQVHDSPRQ